MPNFYNEKSGISTIKMYDILYNFALTETDHLVRILSDGQRHQKYPAFLRRNRLDALRWYVAFSAVLQKTGFETSPAKVYSLAEANPLVSARRNGIGTDLQYGRQNQAYLRYRDSSLQRLLQEPHRSERFSQAFHIAGIPERTHPERAGRHHPCPRPLAQKDVHRLRSRHEPHLRLGFDRPAGLWLENRRGQGGIQSQKTRTTQLLTPDLFRRTYPRYLVWPLASGRYPSCKWSSSALVGLPKEDSQIPLPNPHSCRLWFLRPQVYRTARRGKDWLRGCGQDDRTYPRKGSRTSLSYFQDRGLADSPIQLSALELEKTSPLHCSSPSQTQSQRRRKPTHALGVRRLFLPYLCYQSPLETRSRMAFLQTQSPMRTGHQRTQRRLSSGRYSNQQLPGKPNTFSPHPLELRFVQLVQAPLFAAAMEVCNYEDAPQKPVCCAWSSGLFWRQELPQAATTVSPSKTLFANSQKDRRVQIYIDLPKSYPFLPTSILQKWAFLAFFQVI